MRKIAFIVAAASLFAFGSVADRFGFVLSSLALVWLGVLAAVTASFAFTSSTVGSGAIGAFFSGILAPTSPAVAGAVLLAFVFAERTMRVRDRTAQALHVCLALLGGALAGSLSHAYSSSTPFVFGVAILVAAVLSALPMLIDADDPVAHALLLASESLTGPPNTALVRGVELRRRASDVSLDAMLAEQVDRTWKSLLRLAEVRVRLSGNRSSGGTVADLMDQRIQEHVDTLVRAYAAADTAHAAAVSLDDSAQKSVASMNESIDEVQRELSALHADPQSPPQESVGEGASTT